jgi:hypothetical protein
MRRLERLPAILAASAVALAAVAVVALAPGSPFAASCRAAGSHHAALVLEHGDGSVVTRCVAFGPTAVTGEQLLNSSGVVWSGQTFGGFGEAVCALDAEPAHYAVCPGTDGYWAVFVSRGGGTWQFASVGISSLTLSDGDAEGFRYVSEAGDPAPPPAPAGVCGDGVPVGSPAGASPAAPAGASPAAPAGASPAAPDGSSAWPPRGSSASPPAATTASADASPAPPGGSGIDPGLVAAGLVGAALAGLAGLRLFAARRRAT